MACFRISISSSGTSFYTPGRLFDWNIGILCLTTPGTYFQPHYHCKLKKNGVSACSEALNFNTNWCKTSNQSGDIKIRKQIQFSFLARASLCVTHLWFCSSSLSVLQSLPPLWGLGLVHERWRFWLPNLHVRLQGDQALHCEYRPSMARPINRLDEVKECVNWRQYVSKVKTSNQSGDIKIREQIQLGVLARASLCVTHLWFCCSPQCTAVSSTALGSGTGAWTVAFLAP